MSRVCDCRAGRAGGPAGPRVHGLFLGLLLSVGAGGFSSRVLFLQRPRPAPLREVCLGSAAASSDTSNCWGCSQSKHGNCSFNGVNQAQKTPQPPSGHLLCPLQGQDSAGLAGWDSRAQNSQNDPKTSEKSWGAGQRDLAGSGRVLADLGIPNFLGTSEGGSEVFGTPRDPW